MSSVFDAPTTEQQTTDTQEAPTVEDWVSEVVKEKGEQWQDPQVIAKGYAHAQKRIKELEAIATEVNEKAKEQDYAKALLEQLQAQQAPAATATLETGKSTPSSAEQQDHTSLSPEDIERLLEEKFDTRSKQDKVEKALRDKFGEDANRVVHERAKELNLSIDKLQGLAMESPDAFLRLVGDPAPKETNKSVASSVNTASGFNSNGERNHAYYSKVRRENRKLYNELQPQMMQDRIRLGDKFYQ